MRLLSAFFMVIIMLNCCLLPSFAMEEINKIYIYDSYTIEYNIINNWENNQNIEIIITNTSEESIENWMLSYDLCGEIQGIWNAEIKTTADGIEYVKNAGYNCVIEPDCSANFGYTLSGVEGLPSEFSMCQERVSKTDGYEVTLNVVDSWEDNSFQGEIIITNNTNTAIECWELDIDSNFTIAEITNSWAATVSAYEEGKYTLKGTYTNIIYPNSSTTLGFLGVKNGEPKVFEYSLTEVVVKKINSVNVVDGSDSIVGQLYYKDISSLNDLCYDKNDFPYVKDQILLTAYNDFDYKTIESFVHSIDAQIVGYIELTNDFQIEMNNHMTLEELNSLAIELSNNVFFEYVSLNTAFTTEPSYKTTDILSNPTGVVNTNWNLHAINAFEAWDYYNDMSIVKIGLTDGEFDENHDDLNFVEVWHNVSQNQLSDSHGTHVAGIMAATFNNNTGISGICPKNELYGFSTENSFMNSLKKPTIMMEYKYMLARHIGNNVKVINISQCTDSVLAKKATNGDKGAQKYIEQNAKTLEVFLKKLLSKGYDFVIIVAAGNEGKDAYAKYSHFLNCIGNTDVMNNIIVVGSFGCDMDFWNNPILDSNGNMNFFISDFSNIGDRVDVLAPGEHIYSTVNFNSYGGPSWRGTSMAAPHVAGVAGMMYSVNPNISGKEIKQIIIKNSEKKTLTQTHITANSSVPNIYTYGLLNAEASVQEALALSNNDIYEEKNNGIIEGIVKYNNLKVPNAIIEIKSKTTDVIIYEKTDENGIYELILEPGEYDITYYYDENITNIKHTEKKVCVAANQVLLLDIVLDNKTVTATVIDPYNVPVTAVSVKGKQTSMDKDEEIVVTDSEGMFQFEWEDGEYILSVFKSGYQPQELIVEVIDSILYYENKVLDKISLIPIEASIYGTVTIKNLTTGEEKPQANYTLRILKDGEEYMTATTQADGTYKAQVTEYGTYTIVCNSDNQSECYIGMNIDVEANFTIEYEEEEDEEGNDDEESDDWIDVGEVDIVINFDNGENGQVISPYIGSFENGIYIQSVDGSYVHMYLDMSYEETTTDGLYYLRKGCITYDAYDANGNLIETTQCLSNGNWTWHKKGETISYSVKWVTIDLSRGAYYWVWSRWQGSKGDTASSYWDYPVKKVTLDIIHNAVKVSYTPPEIIA